MSEHVPADQIRAVKEKIRDDTTYALHVLRVVRGRCTDREIIAGRDLGERDGRGFQPVEISFLLELHDRIEARGWAMTAKEATILRERMPKYAKQSVLAVRERGARKRAAS